MNSHTKVIAIGTDHAGFPLKASIIQLLESKGISIIDMGCFDSNSCDYPDFVKPAAKKVISGEADKAIVLGGSGNGEAIAANKVKGIRCALCYDLWTAEMASKHNNANCIAIGSRATSEELSLKIVDKWLSTEFEGGRHLNRIKKIEA
ncbi:MAG: ribose 5-phosphate isomerase B [Opitutae bacterium]|jgi:ribose 5-phosphate isomerase B|nr:ribose 5-phosphate isomerase B [Opitutae bacterium]